MAEPFTLRVFVPTGDPDGLKIVDRMNWTGRGFDIPRESLGLVKQRTDISAPGVYVLVGHEEDELGNDYPLAYVGQAEDVRLRLCQHETKGRRRRHMQRRSSGARRAPVGVEDRRAALGRTEATRAQLLQALAAFCAELQPFHCGHCRKSPASDNVSLGGAGGTGLRHGWSLHEWSVD